MKEYVCKCGSKRIFTRDNGTQTGIYCKECGKWIKWASKKEIPFIEEYIEEQNKNDNSNTNKIDEVREFIMDNLDEHSNVIPIEYKGRCVKSICDLVDATNKKFVEIISFKTSLSSTTRIENILITILFYVIFIISNFDI